MLGIEKAEVVTDRSLIHLRKKAPKGLTNLSISGPVRISGKELGQLLKACPSIDKLALTGPEITDETVSALSEGKNLETLILQDTTLTDDGLKGLKHCENLRGLSICGSKKLTDAGLAHVIKPPELFHLVLLETKVTDKGLATLGSMEKLRSLVIPPKVISNEVRKSLEESFPEIIILEK